MSPVSDTTETREMPPVCPECGRDYRWCDCGDDRPCPLDVAAGYAS
jgi:hypothetical protein